MIHYKFLSFKSTGYRSFFEQFTITSRCCTALAQSKFDNFQGGIFLMLLWQIFSGHKVILINSSTMHIFLLCYQRKIIIVFINELAGRIYRLLSYLSSQCYNYHQYFQYHYSITFIIISYLPFNYIKNLPRFIEGEETQEATRLTTMYLKKNNCCELADWPIQWLFKLKILYFRLKAEKIWRTRDRNRKGVPNFWTFVENCKLLKICTIHKRSIITSCSCTIAVNLAIVTNRLKSNGGNRFLS